MSSSIHAASSPASIASTARTAPHRKRVDFATGYCGLSPPTLFERIGIMAAHGQPLPVGLDAAHQRCARRPEPVKTTPTRIASGPAQRVGSRTRMRVGKRFTGLIDPVKTTPTAVASGPAHAPSPARLDNRKRMAVAKPSSRPIVIHPPRRQRMSARAGPFSRSGPDRGDIYDGNFEAMNETRAVLEALRPMALGSRRLSLVRGRMLRSLLSMPS